MSRIGLRSLFLGIGLLLGCSHQEVANSHQEVGNEPPSKDELAKKYRALIEQLASPNKKPITQNRSGGAVKFPEGYDVEAQNRIDSARQTLYDNFEQALPFLVEALGDSRYCMTIDWAEGDAYYNKTIGSICGNVIDSQLEVYRDKMGFSGPQDWNRYNCPLPKEWKGRSLADLQIESIDWAIAQRSAAIKANNGKLEQSQEISDLQKLRKEIAKSGKPAQPRSMYPMVTSDKGRIR